MAKKRKFKAVRKNGSSNKTKALLLICGVLAFLVAALPTVIVLCVGMVPTLVAYIVDMTPGRYTTRCVAGLNIAGVVPFLDHLWLSSNDLYAAIGIVTDVFAWLAFYVAAGVGWVLFLALPSVVASIKTYNARRKANRLRERLEELKHEWGPEVTGNPADLVDAADLDEDEAGAGGRAAAPA